MITIKEIQKLESMINSKLKNNHIEVIIIESKDGYDGKIIILKDKKVNRVFAIEIISYSQIKISENEQIIEHGLHIEKLGAWIFNLYNHVEYLYVFYGGTLNKKVLTREQVNKKSNETTLDCTNERNQGLLVHRKELDNQPKLAEYLGPMFETIDYGKVYLRYETQEIYNMLSA